MTSPWGHRFGLSLYVRAARATTPLTRLPFKLGLGGGERERERDDVPFCPPMWERIISNIHYININTCVWDYWSDYHVCPLFTDSNQEVQFQFIHCANKLQISEVDSERKVHSVMRADMEREQLHIYKERK